MRNTDHYPAQEGQRGAPEVPARQQEGVRAVQQLHDAARPADEAEKGARHVAEVYRGAGRASRSGQGRADRADLQAGVARVRQHIRASRASRPRSSRYPATRGPPSGSRGFGRGTPRWRGELHRRGDQCLVQLQDSGRAAKDPAAERWSEE